MLCDQYERAGVCNDSSCVFAHGESDLRERQRARECAPGGDPSALALRR
jgi:hypothetical protein